MWVPTKSTGRLLSPQNARNSGIHWSAPDGAEAEAMLACSAYFFAGIFAKSASMLANAASVT